MKKTPIEQDDTNRSSEVSYHEDEVGNDRLGKVSIQDTDNLDETVLGAAAVDNPDLMAPEISRGTESLTEWDEPAGAAGKWTPREGIDDGMLDSGRLVEAGIEEADRERRQAAGGNEED